MFTQTILFQYQSKSSYIIGQNIYYINGPNKQKTIRQLLHYLAFLLHYRAVITLSGDYYIIGFYKGSTQLVYIEFYTCIVKRLVVPVRQRCEIEIFFML